ncbi:DUF1399-domain-containing protein [Exidia glandulosa HHB12029]|uniref:DUF1399-domain-containing protein n=1 Tax=Exidia glandulosa HHB12029 TaxID=1314781 RepID=A0A165EJ88_EXIGL|nr:DUF1399-domain-containing protein [Exidia glandulosa HHB12029]
MAAVQSPPAYTRRDTALPPYSSTLPEALRLGAAHIKPVVTVNELQAHLRLLGAFHELKTRTMADLSPSAATEAWTVFLQAAVRRFEMWLRAGATGRGGRVPSLDVLMVWHAYLLNPLKYARDSRSAVPELATLGPFLLHGYDSQAPESDDYEEESPRELPFSLDLVAAVQRQSSFVEKMVDMGWTATDRFIRDSSALVRSVARYHAFLDLMTACPASFFVPTLDVDLAWHTHQLKATTYREDTLALLNKVLDHDDTVEAEDLANSFQRTTQAWLERFGTAYSGCSNIPPADKAVSPVLDAAYAGLIAYDVHEATRVSGDCGGGCAGGGECGGGCGGGCSTK